MENLIKDFTHEFPQLTPSQKRRVTVGIRPLRKDGIRLEKQIINGKTIVHNYGHGGVGVTLAPATAEEAINLIIPQVKVGDGVSVMGCGINGLMTALACVRKGLKVSIYAERLPKANETNATQMIVSEVAPGFWFPQIYDYTDQKQHQERCRFSYTKYSQWMLRVKSIRKIKTFENIQKLSIDQIARIAPPVAETCKRLKLKIGNRQFNAVQFETLQIHMQRFLQQLIVICRQNGVKFYQKKFNKVDDVTALQTNIIINCLGFGSKKLFGDDKIYGLKGYMIEYNNSTKIKGIFGFLWNNQPVKLYCFDEKILIGLTKQNIEDTEIVPQTVLNLQNRIYSFYNSLGLNKIQPKL